MTPALTLTLMMRSVGICHHRLDLGAQVDGVGDQPFFLGLQVEDAGVAGVGAVLEDGDRSLHQVQAGVVLELQAEQRELGVHGLVVDADLGGVDVLVDDGQQGRLLPRQADRAAR